MHAPRYFIDELINPDIDKCFKKRTKFWLPMRIKNVTNAWSLETKNSVCLIQAFFESQSCIWFTRTIWCKQWPIFTDHLISKLNTLEARNINMHDRPPIFFIKAYTCTPPLHNLSSATYWIQYPNGSSPFGSCPYYMWISLHVIVRWREHQHPSKRMSSAYLGYILL